MPAVNPDSSTKSNRHVPVLLTEVIEQLRLAPGMTAVDATLGNAGHAELIAKSIGSSGTLVGLDADPLAIQEATWVLDQIQPADKPKVTLVHTNFAHLQETIQQVGIGEVDAVVFDLGLRRGSLEDTKRGFSFQRPHEPLDMRFNPSDDNLLTAAEIVNSYDEVQLADLFYHLADERRSRQYAAAIVASRQQATIKTVGDLVEIITTATPGTNHRRSPATKVFQALRMTVNHELEVLLQAIDQAVAVLKSGGRVGIITFHSVEDRVVKVRLKQLGQEKAIQLDPKKPIKPSREEVVRNRLSRSALLRVATKL